MPLGQIISLLIVGAVTGTLAGGLVTRRREGFGHLLNLLCGVVGALIGGGLFNLLHINLGLGSIAVSLEDLVVAFVGALLLLGIVALLRGPSKKPRK